MKKRILSIALALCLVFSLLPVSALADEAPTSGTCGNNLTWSLDDSGTLTVSGTGNMTGYSSSKNADGDYVTTAPWGKHYKSIKSVVIEDGVTSIGSHAFYGCSSLTSITIPDSVTGIGNYAFRGCSSLTSVTIPDSVTSVDAYTFRGCSSLTSVTIPNSVTSIGDSAFEGCSSIKNVYYTGDVSSWLGISFHYSDSNPCKHGANLYFNGEIVTDVVIPNSVTKIGNSAFYGCSSLKSISIPDSVTSIGWGAFSGCSSLTSVTIPDSVTSIDYYAFSGCSSLTSVTIPDSVTSIGYSVFSGCSSLTSVTIPDSVTRIGSYAFYGCSSLTSVTIPDSVTSVDAYTFRGCSSLTSVTIPNSVTSIGDSAFEGCSSIKNVYYTGDVSSWLDISFGGLDSNPCQSGANLYFNGELVTDVVIPNSVTKIDNYVFEGCSSLTSVTIGRSVTSIGWYAFRGCSSLTSVTMGNGVTRIGSYAFYGCSSLTSVTIPDSVTRIDNDAFRDCSSLTSVTIGDSVTGIGNSAFYDCSSLTSVTIGRSVTSIGDYAFLRCNNLKDVAFGGTKEAWNAIGYTFSGVRMHYNCASLEGHYVPMEVKESSCTSTGYTKYSCTCGFEYIEEIPENHNFVYSKTVAPTCGEHGYDLMVCSKCGREKKEYKDDELLKHSYQIVVVEPSCLTGGYTLHKCSVCGNSYKDELVQPLGHSEVSAEAKAPTCTEAGHTAGICCSRCGKTMSGMEEIAALSHNFGEWTQTKAPTCTASGTEIRTCTRCNATETREIAATVHHYTEKVTAPTCTAKGYTTHTCVCGDSYVDSYTDALGHSYKNGICTRCNAKSPNYVAAPVIKITTSAGKPKISWNAVDGATKYWVYRSTDGKNFKYYDKTTKTSYTNSSTTIGTTYYYKVKAVKTVNGKDIASDYSATKSIKCAPAAPTVSISRSNGKPKLSWKAVTGATKYWIYRSTDGKNFKYYDMTTKTSYTNSGAASGTKYYYKVKAVKVVNSTNVASAYSYAKSLVCTPATPNVSITSVSGKPKLSWNAVNGATKYWIYRSTDGKNFKYYDSTTKTTYTNNSTTVGTRYYYKVKAVVVDNGTSYASAFSNSKSLVCTPATPNVSITSVSGKPKLSWNAVNGATKYWIYRSTDGENFKYYDSTTKTTYTNNSTTVGTRYYYKVKAVVVDNGTSYASAFSSSKSLLVSTAAPIVKTAAAEGTPSLSWNAVNGADKYWVYRSTDGKNFKYYDSTTKTTYTNKSVTAGTTYYYKVKAVKVVNGSSIASQFSNSVSVKA